MGFFRQKIEDIEAVRWLDGIIVEGFPQWLRLAIEKPYNDEGSVTIFGNEVRVTIDNVLVVVNDGDWIFKDINGKISVIDNDSLNLRYNKIK